MIDTRYRFWAADDAEKKTIMFLWNISVPRLLILIEMKTRIAKRLMLLQWMIKSNTPALTLYWGRAPFNIPVCTENNLPLSVDPPSFHWNSLMETSKVNGSFPLPADRGSDGDVFVVERPEDLAVESVLLSRDEPVDLLSFLQTSSALAQ